jgi:hypothetical protein
MGANAQRRLEARVMTMPNIIGDKTTTANRSTTTERFVTIYNSDRYGIQLGDLRKLLARTEDLPDDADVTVEELVKHYSRIDVFMAKRVSVMHRAGATDDA